MLNRLSLWKRPMRVKRNPDRHGQERNETMKLQSWRHTTSCSIILLISRRPLTIFLFPSDISLTSEECLSQGNDQTRHSQHWRTGQGKPWYSLIWASCTKSCDHLSNMASCLLFCILEWQQNHALRPGGTLLIFWSNRYTIINFNRIMINHFMFSASIRASGCLPRLKW